VHHTQTQEIEVGGSQVRGQPRQHSETPTSKKKNASGVAQAVRASA
jgi:hypothetical protein